MKPALQLVGKLFYRNFTSEDYEIVKKWWLSRGEAVVKPEWLSSLGIVVENENGPACMTWLYISNSRMAQVGWTTTRPGLSPRDSHEAVMMAIESIQKLSQNIGVTYLHSMCNKSGLTKVMKRLGFEKKDGYAYLAWGDNGN